MRLLKENSIIKNLMESVLDEGNNELIKETVSEDENGVINAEDEEYYDGKLWEVGLYPGAGYELVITKVYANYEEEALNKVVVWCENHAKGLIFSLSDVEDIVKNDFEAEYESNMDKYGEDWMDYAINEFNYVYVDATAEGASEPYFVDGSNLMIREIENVKESAIVNIKDKASWDKYVKSVDSFDGRMLRFTPNKIQNENYVTGLKSTLENEIGKEIVNWDFASKNAFAIFKEGTSIPRNASRIKLGDEEYSRNGGYWVKTSEKDNPMPTYYPSDFLRTQSRFDKKDIEVLDTDKNYKPTRTREVKVLQGNYGYGWDDLLSYDVKDKEEMQNLKRDLKDYRENEPNAQHRVITRREKIEESVSMSEPKPADKDTKPKAKIKDYLNYELEDDDTETGGVSFNGETVEDFIADTDMSSEDDLDKLNKALVSCGIKPINESSSSQAYVYEIPITYGPGDVSNINVVVTNGESSGYSYEELKKALSGITIYNNDTSGEEYMQDIKLNNGRWLEFKGKEGNDRYTTYNFTVIHSYKESSNNATLYPEDLMCGFIGDLFKNMAEGFTANSESLYDWCEGGDTFRNAGFDEETCKKLDRLLKELDPLVCKINDVIYEMVGEEDLNESAKRTATRAWSDDGNSLNIREMVARFLEDEDSSNNITDEEVDKVAGCVLDDDEFISKLDDLIREAALKATNKTK